MKTLTMIATMAAVGTAGAGVASTFDFNDPALQDMLVSSVTTSDGAITADLSVRANRNRRAGSCATVARTWCSRVACWPLRRTI